MRVSAVFAVSLLLLPLALSVVPGGAGGDPTSIVTVGDQDQIRTRNVLRAFLGSASAEDWGLGVLEPVYSRLLLRHPVTGELLPYLAKGADADGDGTFESLEYGALRKDLGTNGTDIVVYFDFNGVVWHDGVQVTVMDLFFTLVISSLSSRFNTALIILWDRAGGPTSNFTWDRWLAVELAPKSWENEGSIPGNPDLRVALRFRLQAPYARFYEDLLGGLTLLPRHVWEQTGGGRHADFGRAIYPEGHPRSGQGIPVNETLFKAFDYAAAESWSPGDADVIGSGPFKFGSLEFGVSTRIVRNDRYYVGADLSNPTVVYDARLARLVHLPFVDGFLFKIFRTLQLGVIALKSGDVDYLRTNILPEFVPDLLNDAAIRVWAFPEAGFMYLGYNVRRPWLGYGGTPPGDAVDTGRPFRMASAHLLDKRMFVTNILQNYGVVADSVVSPANTLYYNGTLPHRAYDLDAARTILDNAGFVDTDGDGWRELPVRGDAGLEVLTPIPDYDPIRPAVGAMWTGSMQAVGLNVTSRPTALGQILQRVEARDFDMAILMWKIPDWDPDYLFALFHCSAASGLNFPGYCDSALDRTLEQSRTTMDLGERARLIKAAQGIIMDDRPVEPLLYRTSLQAARMGPYVNWSGDLGTVWTYWSWIGVKPLAKPQQLKVELRYDSAMTGGSAQRIEVTVRRLDGSPFVGASVALQILREGDGSFAETGSRNLTGTTGPTGGFAATYLAPVIPGAPRFVAFEVVVSHDSLSGPVRRGFEITVFREADQFLSIRVTLPAGDIGLPDTSLPIRIDVKDETGAPVTDGTVAAAVLPGNGTLSRTNGTAQEMGSLLFSPPSDLRATLPYRISLAATKSGYHPANANVSLLVVVPAPVPTTPPEGVLPELDLGLVAAAVASAVVLGLAFTWWVVRSRQKARGP